MASRMRVFPVLLAICVALSWATATAQDAAVANPLTIVDPYLLKIPASGSLAVSAVVTAATAGKSTAKGIVADGTSAAIAVLKVPTKNPVSFSATNGAKVSAYKPAFLTAVFAGRATAAVSPILVSGSYYALALVMSGTAPDAEHGADITIAATQKNTAKFTATASLLTVPTPVVLIHGLWGDKTSLASTESYLKANAAFKTNAALVTPICYSVYLNFDAATDTLPGHGTGCEMTSAQALSAYLSTTLYKQLDADHFVGGRVDVVAHSMGGLVARHFSTTSQYNSVRNRMLGAFRNVITLDTPETGSALATYLDDVAADRTLMDSNITSQPYQLWTSFCGTNPKTTIEVCFDKNGLPLAYPGQPLSTGAVASLIPGGASIKSAPAPTIFNTSYGKWFAIASDWKDTDKPVSILRTIVDDLIAATYASGQTIPTTSSVLGTLDNDVIVTLASQTATAPAKQVKVFKDLAHTGFAGLNPPPPYSDASVTDSMAVNAQAAFWLGLQTSTTPAMSEEWPSRAEELDERAGENATVRSIGALFEADERLAVLAPEHSVGLGQPVQVALSLKGPKTTEITVEQLSALTGRRLSNELRSGQVVSGQARIVAGSGGVTTVEVTPLATRTLVLRVTAMFADGGFARQEVLLNVEPSQRRLESFELNGGFHSLALVIDDRDGDRDEDREAFLAPVVRYETLRYPIYLEASEPLNLTVDQPEDDPVIRVDANGVVHALRPGKALITGDFDGVRDSVEVEVFAKENAPAGYRRGED